MKISIESTSGHNRYDSHTDGIVHVEPAGPEAIPFTIHPIAPRLAGKAFETILLEPDQRKTNSLTLVFPGIGADYQQYGDLVQAIATEGLPVALQKTPAAEPLPALAELWQGRKRESFVNGLWRPYIHGSKTAVAIADAATEYAADRFGAEYDGVMDYAHSKGGLPTIIHANFDSRTRMVFNDATSGIVQRMALPNHLESVLPIVEFDNLSSDDGTARIFTLLSLHKHIKVTIPLLHDVRSILASIPDEERDEIFEQFKQNKGQIALEVMHLLGKRPDITAGLEELKKRNVPVVYVSRDKDSIFKDKDTKHAAKQLLRNGLIREHIRVEDSTHHAPIENPHGTARLYSDVVQKYASEDEQKLAG